MLPSYKTNIPESRFTPPHPNRADIYEKAYLRALATAIQRDSEQFVEHADIEDVDGEPFQACLPVRRAYPEDAKLAQALNRLRYYRYLDRLSLHLPYLDKCPDYNSVQFMVYWASLNELQYVADHCKHMLYADIIKRTSRFVTEAINYGRDIGQLKYPLKDGDYLPNWVVSKQTAWRHVCAARKRIEEAYA